MKLLPMDIKQQHFRRSLRGYSPLEVHTFLDVVSQSFGEVIQENQNLKDELHRLSTQVNDFKEKESTLKEAMLTAQRICEDMRHSSKKEVDLLMQEAELKAERILGDAHQKMIKIMDRIQDLKIERERQASGLRHFLEQQLKVLDAQLSDDLTHEQRDANLAFIKTSKNVPKE